MNIIPLYEQQSQERNWYVSNAEKLASVTIPSLYPNFAYSNTTTPWITSSKGTFAYNNTNPVSTAGTQAVTQLASALNNMMFPYSGQWFDIAVGNVAKDSPEIETRPEILDLKQNMLRSMADHMLQAEMLEALTRILVDGQVVLEKRPFGRTRHIPLPRFTVTRVGGSVATLITCEDTAKKTKDGAPIRLYKYVDYEANEVYQQFSDSDTAQKVSDQKPYHFIVASSTMPSGNYCDGYAQRYYGTMYNLNELAKYMLQAAHIAAQSVLLVDSESGLTQEQIKGMQPGQVFMLDLNGGRQVMSWMSAGNKLSDWSWTYQYIETERSNLNKGFAVGLSQNPDLNQSRQTATTTQRIASEIDAAIGALGQVAQVTLQKPLANAYMLDELEMARQRSEAKGEIPSGGKPIDVGALQALNPTIISGPSSLSRMIQVEQMIGLVGQFAAVPEVAATFDFNGLFMYAANVIGIPVEQFQKQQQPQQMQQQNGMSPPTAA